MQHIIVQASYLFCALAFLVLTGLTLMSKTRPVHSGYLLAASGATVLWSLAIWFVSTKDTSLSIHLIILLELGRSLLWVAFLVVIIGLTSRGADLWFKSLVVAGSAAPLGLVLTVIVADQVSPFLFSSQASFFFTGLARMMIAIVGLLLLENLYRNADLDQKWATKYLCFGLGLIFAYDFFFYAEAVIFQRLSTELHGARGFVTGMAAPLITLSVARARYWTVDLHVSRKMVFHTAAIMGAGFYLVFISGVGFYVREYGGEAGAILQIVFLAFAAVLLMSVAASGSVRSRIKLFIAKNFYSARYDYREEWLRVIGTISSGDGERSLHQRIVWAIAPIVDSTAAALWVVDEAKEDFLPTISWNFGPNLSPLERSCALVTGLLSLEHVIDLTDTSSGDGTAIELPDEITRERQAWLAIPLIHQHNLYAILLLGQPRVARTFDREDRDLIETVAQQAASYIAEDEAAGALSQARKMEEFNQRFAFIAHDLKNIVNQLSIMVQNSEHHGDNPDFNRDMVKTVSNAVGRMKTMMEDLTAQRAGQGPAGLQTVSVPLLDLSACLDELGEHWQAATANLQLDLAEEPFQVRAKKTMVTSVFNHILQNAVEATGPEGLIVMRSRRRGQNVVIDIIDDGPGMDPDFVRTELFKPFHSSKKGGYGIGGFQIRQLVRDLGGRLEVLTELGQGTTMRVHLPQATPTPEPTPEPTETPVLSEKTRGQDIG